MDEPPSPFSPYLYLLSTRLSTDETPSPTDGPSSSTDEPPSPMDELPSPTDEPPSSLLKSRIPRKTIIVDPSVDPSGIYEIDNFHCPLRKGIIYYHRNDAIIEHDIYSSGKHEPRIIVPKHGRWSLAKFSFVPIKGNQILLFAKYVNFREENWDHFLHLSIHKIRSDNRVDPALWSFGSSVDRDFDIFGLELTGFTENPLAITFWARFGYYWTLFETSTTKIDASDTFPLIESGRIDFDSKIRELKLVDENIRLVKLSPDGCILLSANLEREVNNETITIYYSDSGGTNFSFVTHMSIPITVPEDWAIDVQDPTLVFSADGSKFAIVTHPGRVSIWDIRSKVPLKTFITVPECNYVKYLQFSSGKLGKEVLVLVVRSRSIYLDTIHVIDATSFETEETIFSATNSTAVGGFFFDPVVGALFFDPSGETLYAEHDGTLYEWDLQKNTCGPEWWIGEE